MLSSTGLPSNVMPLLNSRLSDYIIHHAFRIVQAFSSTLSTLRIKQKIQHILSLIRHFHLSLLCPAPFSLHTSHGNSPSYTPPQPLQPPPAKKRKTIHSHSHSHHPTHPHPKTLPPPLWLRAQANRSQKKTSHSPPQLHTPHHVSSDMYVRMYPHRINQQPMDIHIEKWY